MKRRPGWLPELAAQPVVIGHRGLGKTAGHGENSLAAFVQAWEQGLTVVECDVRRTADGIWLVIHDATLARTHGLDIAVADLAWREPRAWPVEPPPTLEAVLAATGPDRSLVIEVKPAPSHEEDALEDLARILFQAPAPRDLMVISFDPAIVGMLRDRLPDVPLGLLEDNPGPGAYRRTAELDADAWWPRADRIETAELASCRAAGLAVMAWTARNLEDCLRLSGAGVDAFGSDHPVLHWEQLRQAAAIRSEQR
ncbi:MAG: glycerophosphodiester phosphodiesterase [Candidatus Sericytochromatia bacterium]|nr:glycerophosphodiester phosphodiesterase [Candidatus Sericytochromatia bacterium]